MDLTIIKHAVEVDHGIKRLSMRFIKQCAAPGRARLSAELCAEISRELGELGLITLPQTLPASENEYAWVIQKDSELGEVVSVAVAIAHLDALNMSPIPHLFANYPTAKASLS